MADKLIIDCTKGVRRTEPLTDDEVAEREDAAAQVEPDPVDRVAALEARLDRVAAKADEAAVTAQELADAARERKP